MAMTDPFFVNRRALLALGATLAAGTAAGCADDAATAGASGSTGSGGDDLSDVIYEGGATDEALVALLAQAPTADAAQGTHFLAPAAGATLDPSAPATFSWAVGPTARRPSGLLERAIGLLLGVREAHAHGTPISGRAYFIVFSTPSEPKLLRVFTTALTYAPQADAWAKLTSAGGTVTVDIINAIFETNRVADGGGPFSGTPATFQIG